MQLTSILYHLSQWLQSPSVKGQSKVDWGTWMASEIEQSLLHNGQCNLHTSPGWSLWTETPSQGKTCKTCLYKFLTGKGNQTPGAITVG